MINIKNLINSLKFRFYVGKQYINSKKKNGKSNIIFYSLFAGIAGGLTVLIVVLGVMNGFQNNHISRRIEIGTYHAVIKKGESYFKLDELPAIKEKLYSEFGHLIEAAVPYADKEIIAFNRGPRNSHTQVIKLRIIDEQEIIKDSRFLTFFQIADGELTLEKGTILIGRELSPRLFTLPGRHINLTPGINLRSLKHEGIPFKVSGLFETGSYEYDRYWGYISLESLQLIDNRVEIDNIGLKFKKGVKRKQASRLIEEALPEGYRVILAEEINRSYFAALKLEKVMIIFLFCMIFLMAATNIFGALKLTVIEKKSDILILKAIGLTPADIEVIFIIESLLLGFGGSLAGTILGVFVSYNINNIFGVIESVLNWIIRIVIALGQNFVPGFYMHSVKIYDDSIYYQSSFLVKIYLNELIIMSFLITAMTVIAAYIPISKASGMKPNELLRRPNL